MLRIRLRVCQRKPPRNVLWSVPVEGLDADLGNAPDARSVPGQSDNEHQFRSLLVRRREP